jgi:hypothetical protein
VVGELLTFMDSVIAVQRIKAAGIPINRPLHAEQEIVDYATEYLAVTQQGVAIDKSLSAPMKIGLCGLTGESELEANAYVQLRNAIEHHGGVPAKDIILTLKALQLITTSGSIITGPMTLEAGEGIAMRLDIHKKICPKGVKVTLTPDEMKRATFTVETFAREIIERESSPKP